MTVCIAALYNNGKGCVMVSDQMVTAHFGLGYEFENDEVTKIAQIDSAIPCYALIAGNVVFANEVFNKAESGIRDKGIASIDGIANSIRDAYQNVRRIHVVRNEIEPRGLTLDTYYQHQQKITPSIVKVIDDALYNWNPKVSYIIAGKEEGSCHIYNVINPGDYSCVDCVGFTAIGTGAPHAIFSLIESGYKKSMGKEEVKEIVLNAKKRSEVAPGVGKQTKEVII